MISDVSATAAAEVTRQLTGIVIPIYLPPGRERAVGEALLRDNVAACVGQLDDPQRLCLSVDGTGCGEEVAADLSTDFGVQHLVAPANKGKLQAVRGGMARLAERRELQYFTVIDSDGDHFANELPNLLRAALHARAAVADREVLVLGRRISLHRPLGFLRGELEELADRVLLDALAYEAAVSAVPLRLELSTTLDEVPDFHSGYKLFSRGAAECTFLGDAELCGVTEAAYFRHACEAVMVVEALKGGALLTAVNRSTMNEQPVSSFGQLNRVRLVADKIVWPCRRLGVPGHFVAQWLRNHMPRLLLTTLSPQGREELQQIGELVLGEFGIDSGEAEGLVSGPQFL